MRCFSRTRRAATVCSALGWLCCSACSEPAPEPPPDPPRHGTVVADFVARVQPSLRRLRFEKPAEGPGLSPQSIDSLPIVQDGTPGSGPASTVELVTNSVGDTLSGDTCPGATPGVGAFCANVTLNHFYPRPLGHVHVQATAITDVHGGLLANHAALFGDPTDLGLDASHGLWRYSAPASTTQGVLGLAPDNGGAREWVFGNPDDAETLIGLRVVAALTYAGYTRAAASLPFVDACAGGTQLGAVTTSVQSLPFPFTFYEATYDKVTLNRRGVLALGASTTIAPAKPVPLPSSGAVPNCTLFKQCAVPRPAVFPFWNNLLYLGAGGLCTATSGSAPNRTFAATWRHVQLQLPADITSDYTFTVVLHEGSDVIDLLYGDMLGPLPDAAGGAATIGVQNAAGTVATSETNQAHYGSGTSWTFTPVP